MATTSLQRRVRLGGRLRLGRGLRARSRLRVGPHALAIGMLEGLPYVAILLPLLLLLLVLFLILLFIYLFLLCASRLSTRQSKVDGTLVVIFLLILLFFGDLSSPFCCRSCLPFNRRLTGHYVLVLVHAIRPRSDRGTAQPPSLAGPEAVTRPKPNIDTGGEFV